MIFYDSDWNPAMDAQAQDRAHRIGQTRDVHIYRFITEHTIEENILSKAKQKKNLDILVMDQGKFDASAVSAKGSSSSGDDGAIYTKKGLQSILGIPDDEQACDLIEEVESKRVNKEQMEMAMTSLEDEDDVRALRGAQKEVADELKEFDETAEIQKNSDEDDDDVSENKTEKNARKKQKTMDTLADSADQTLQNENIVVNDLEKEFAAWQSTVGFDGNAIESSLTPMEKYGLRFREDVDPFYSIFMINEERRRMETIGGEDIDIEEIEREKASEECKAMEDGDLLATGIQPKDLIRQRNLYRREKARLRSDKKRRKLTGENWSQRVDGVTQKLFWYNEDTGEAIWDVPRVVMDLRAAAAASKEGWSRIPMDPLVHIMYFLPPFPDRQSCSMVCRQWKQGTFDVRFVRHVYPVEMHALARESSRRDHNHFRTVADALSVALPGDSIGKGNRNS